MKKCLLLVFAIVFCSASLLAQRTVTGTITGAEDNAPLIGASIIVVGTSIGTVQDFEGNYSPEVPERLPGLT